MCKVKICFYFCTLDLSNYFYARRNFGKRNFDVFSLLCTLTFPAARPLYLCGLHLHIIFAYVEAETITENHFRIRGPCVIPAEFMATVAFGEPIEMLINLHTAFGRQLNGVGGWAPRPSLNATFQLS